MCVAIGRPGGLVICCRRSLWARRRLGFAWTIPLPVASTRRQGLHLDQDPVVLATLLAQINVAILCLFNQTSLFQSCGVPLFDLVQYCQFLDSSIRLSPVLMEYPVPVLLLYLWLHIWIVIIVAYFVGDITCQVNIIGRDCYPFLVCYMVQISLPQYLFPIQLNGLRSLGSTNSVLSFYMEACTLLFKTMQTL